MEKHPIHDGVAIILHMVALCCKNKELRAGCMDYMRPMLISFITGIMFCTFHCIIDITSLKELILITIHQQNLKPHLKKRSQWPM